MSYNKQTNKQIFQSIHENMLSKIMGGMFSSNEQEQAVRMAYFQNHPLPQPPFIQPAQQFNPGPIPQGQQWPLQIRGNGTGMNDYNIGFQGKNNKFIIGGNIGSNGDINVSFGLRY